MTQSITPANSKHLTPQVLMMLIACQVVVLLPHSLRLPLWLTMIMVVCAIWRWCISNNHWRYPGIWLKTALTLLGSILIISHYGIRHSLDIWCALLVLSFSLKILETSNKRDAYAVLFLAYFILCVAFIFNQSLLLTSYQLVSVTVITASMITLNQADKHAKPNRDLKLATKLLLQSLPLMLILFIVFPRIMPFWNMPRPITAKTGLSSEMTPGDIAQLTQSDEIVFRAVFEDKPPPTQDLYWRGLVYSDFHLGKWSKAPPPSLIGQTDWIEWSGSTPTHRFIPNLEGQQKITYQVLQEPNHQVWQFGLDLAVPQPFDNGLSRDFRLVSRKPIHSLTRYVVDSYPLATLDEHLPDGLRRRETRLAANDNPAITDHARTVYQSAKSDEDFINTILNEIRTGLFRYTLSPPTLPRINSIDQFWFETRSGFCTHYAGALVYLLRAVGIPARMVGGYQGGEVNPVSGHVVVRQYHAHAWVEAWLPELGWKRIDPTAAVAPDRVENGLEAALQESERATLSLFTHARLGNRLGVAKMMYWVESLEHRWNMMVVGYDANKQLAFLTRLLGTVTAPRIAMLLLLGILLSSLIAAISLLNQMKLTRPDPLLRLLKHFSNAMAARGYQREVQESFPAFLRRIGSEQPKTRMSLEESAQNIEFLMYATQKKASKNQIHRIKKELQALLQGIQLS